MKKMLLSLFLVCSTTLLFAEPKELKGKVSPSEVEMKGKKVKTYVLKTAEGDVSINPKVAKRLKKFEGKDVVIKADVNEENSIEKITSIKAEKKKKK